MLHAHQYLNPARTTWHITWGTYGTRLHGSSRATVDKQHNQRGTPFVPRDASREEFAHALLAYDPVMLAYDQRVAIEDVLPSICLRGGWDYRTCAAAPDHVHLLCDVPRDIHGEKVRRLAKRWLGQQLNERWPLADGATWWAEEGSNIAIHDEAYLNNAFRYVERQRATHAGAGPARS
jgi:REP element-mobilizing transposase RayT